MSEPATTWQEIVPPGEAERLEAFAAALASMQKGISAKVGPGRGLHRKPQGILAARLEVDGSGPAWTRHGVFAAKRHYDVVARLSNASALLQPDRAKDIRGFAFKILGLNGPGAPGGTVTSQDFLCINQETFGMKDAGDFIPLAIAASKGPPALLGHLWKTRGFGMFAGLKKVVATINRPFKGFLVETFSTTLPFACGPFAARLRIVPCLPSTSTTPVPGSFLDDIKTRLAAADVVFNVQLQPFVDEGSTPIENAEQPWDEAKAPWATVGTLTVVQQSLDDAAARERQTTFEGGRFDPWNALVEHRPLGHIMRARKAAYFASQQARGAT